MYTKSSAYVLPLPPPFNAPSTDPSIATQYIIQLTVPSSSPTDHGDATRLRGAATASIIVWAGIGRIKRPTSAAGGREMNAYERALAEELADGEEPQLVEAAFEGSKKLGQDWACAMPTTLRASPVASSTLMNGIEAETSGTAARSGRARGMAERLAKRFHTQLLLSLDVPPAVSLLSSMDPGGGTGGVSGLGGGLPGMDPLGDKLYLGLERALVRALEVVL